MTYLNSSLNYKKINDKLAQLHGQISDFSSLSLLPKWRNTSCTGDIRGAQQRKSRRFSPYLENITFLGRNFDDVIIKRHQRLGTSIIFGISVIWWTETLHSSIINVIFIRRKTAISVKDAVHRRWEINACFM